MSTSRRWFGTDGIRAPFGQAPLDEPTVRALGLALGARLVKANGHAPKAVIGGDTRASTPTLSRWLADGLRHHGVEIDFVGTLPTPGIAWLVRRRDAQVGIAVSASHNPSEDNGIKLIDGRGFKWDPTHEATLEDAMAQLLAAEAAAREAPSSESLPPADEAGISAYLDALADSVTSPREPHPLAGLHVAIDAAHGAASAFAEPLFRRLGADVSITCASPDGNNINRGCGSTHPEVMAALTRSAGADLGIAFDGDADRVIVADEHGVVRDGDALLYLWSRDMRQRGALRGDAIVATSMSNLGLEVALGEHGITLARCDVGDRAVVQTLVDRGLVLGGEQSGHIVNLDLSTTGDGMLTALHIAALRARAAQPLSELLSDFERFPQLIENVPVTAKPDFASLPTVVAAQREVDDLLGNNGRLVLRYSGTEPLARIMLEGPELATIQALADKLADAIRADLG